MRVVLVTNRRSGGSADPDRLAGRLRDGGAAVVVLDIADHERLRDLTADRVLVAGGDGSLGPVAAACSATDTPLAVVPNGTANDFARALDLPLGADEAVALALRADAPTRAVALYRAGGRPFLNAAAAGLSVDAAEKAAGLKAALGPLAYAVGALRAGTTSDPIDVTVTAGDDDEPLYDGPAWQVIVAGTGAFGGGSQLDVADPATGVLDVAVLVAERRAELVARAVGMRRGDLVDQDGVLHATAARITVAGPERFNVDGEVCAVDGGAFTHEGERVTVVVP